MIKIIKNNLPIIFLAFIAVFICFNNYTPGTILSGWDTLHPEFNFGLGLKREIFGVFRSYQGLGAVAAHSDMADLPRIVLLAIFDLFLPLDSLRYSYIFLTLIIGPIGMYLFLYKHVLKDKTSSFLGGLFYLLNLGTMQQFAVPFEMFVTQYAALPWLFLFSTMYIYDKTHQKRTLLLFAVTTLLSAPMAYAATLWYIYFIAFILYIASLTILNSPRRSPFGHLRGGTKPSTVRYLAKSLLGGGSFRERSHLFKKAFTLILLTLLLNSFWILPNIYYVFAHGSQVPQANINKLFSEQAFLYNKEFGNIKDIAMLKSFLFDWSIYADNNNFTQLLHQWIQHLKQPFVEPLAYLFGLTSLCGIIYSIFNPFDKLRVNAERSRSIKRNKILITLLPLLFLCLFFLFNDNPPTSLLYSFLKEEIPLFKEAFRFPADKVLGIFTFLFAIYFAAGQLMITRIFRLIAYSSSESRATSRESREVNNATMKQLNNDSSRQDGYRTVTRQARTISKTELAQIIIIISFLFYFMLPAFKGHLISPYMRIKIPEYYFEMFKWFDKQAQDGRVANLPINSFWGWEYHNWDNNALPNFQGAGFIWFGIKQPVLARDFDRWIPYNEQYYREMSYAIYSQSPETLKLVVDKYNIKYILLDKSLIDPPNSSKVPLYTETEKLLEKQDYIQKIKEFGNTLLIYKVNSKPSSAGTETPNQAYLAENPTYIYPESQAFYEDVAYKDYGNYIIAKDGVYYPLRNLIDNQNRILPNALKLTQEGVVIKLPKDNPDDPTSDVADGQLYTLPSYLNTEESIASDLLVEKSKQLLKISLYPRFPIYNIKDRPIPIATEIPMPKNENIILSINRKDNFILNTSTLDFNTPLSLGVIFLATKNDNTIAIYPALSECDANAKSSSPWCGVYPSIPNEQILPDLSTTNYYIEPCEPSYPLVRGEDTGGQKIFGAELIENNSFYIFGKNVPLCMTIPLSEVLSNGLKYQEALLNVKFNYSSSLPLRFCIAKLINGACQNYRNNSLLQYFGIQNKDLETLGIQFQLDTTESNTIEKALYSNLSLSLTYPFFSTVFSSDALKKSIEPLTQLLSKPSTLILPFSGNQQLSTKITEFPITTGYCPNQASFNPPIIRKQILKESKHNFIRYVSEEGTACDHFSYQNLSQNEAYLIAVTSRNIKGLPLTICVANQVSKHCDIYASLSTSHNFTTDIFLLPPFIKNENGFDVNIRNLGIKKTPAINDLKSIQIIPFPYKWLSQIRRYPHPNPLPRGEGIKRDPLSREVGEGGGEGGVLVLPYSFEKGWKAYQVQSSKFKVQSWVNMAFPFFFGQELKNHVLVNNWSNGWILNNQTMKQFNNDNNSTIVTAFLPQYLEYLGFVFLAGTIIYLVKMRSAGE